MPFESILYPGTGHVPPAAGKDPPYFRDLNLDQVVATVTKPFAEFELAPFFQVPLADPDAIRYRQEAVEDLQDPAVLDTVRTFAAGMRRMCVFRDRAEKLYYQEERQRWHLAAVGAYGEAVEGLSGALDRLACRSRAFAGLAEHLRNHIASDRYRSRTREAAALEGRLASVRYAVFLRGSRVTVRPYSGQPDYAAEVEATFERFRRGAVTDYRVNFPGAGGLNHVEAQILERVAKLDPEPFALLADFCARHARFADPVITRFDHEVHVYVAYLAHIASLAESGLGFVLPEITGEKDIDVEGTFDLALAARLNTDGGRVVTNDLRLSGPERILVVSGPNQGGKTTYARMVGQLHHLARLGLPVPGRRARLFVCDRIRTHFEKQETIQDLRGKLQDDLVRVHDMLAAASSTSLLIFNETFSSTTVQDAAFLSRRVMERIFTIDAVAVWVTFLDELSRLSERTVSVVSTVDPADPALRTFRVERRPADGLAYALAIAEKHRVTRDWLARRLTR